MAHTFDTSIYATGVTVFTPSSFFTPGAGVTLLVLGINVAGATVRTNFATSPPTFGGRPLTIVNTAQKAATSPEIVSELWYLTNPSIGRYAFNVPNTGALTLYLRASTYKAAAGYTSIFNASIGGNGTSANPTLTLSASDGGVIVGVLGSGYTSVPSAYNGKSILPVDHGALNSVNSYKLIAANGNASLGYTLTSDDWGLVMGSWSEQLIEVPGGRVYGGIMKYYNGASWVECPSSNLKFYNGSDWTVCPSGGFKVFVDNDWFPVRREG